jgi:hypothetical protein
VPGVRNHENARQGRCEPRGEETMKTKYLILMLITLSMTGCGYKAKVESDTSWSGYINNATVDGSGNRTIDLDRRESVVVQKGTKRGYLKVTIISDNPLSPDGETSETTAEYGVVTANP